MTVYLRKAEPSDLPDILAIIEDGRRTLQKSGIPQWQNGDGPNQEILAKDIDQQTCYILMVEDALAGVGVLCSRSILLMKRFLMVLGNLILKLRIRQFIVLL